MNDEMGKAPAPQPVQGEAVAWQCRYIDPDEGPGMWRHCEPENVAVFNARGSRYETRALYAQPPTIGQQAVDDAMVRRAHRAHNDAQVLNGSDPLGWMRAALTAALAQQATKGAP